MSKIVFLMNSSLDGYISRPGGDLDWANVDEELHRYFNQEESTHGHYLYGRRLYEVMNAYWPTAESQPDIKDVELEFARIYNSIPMTVFSRTLQEAGNARLERKVDAEQIRRQKAQSEKDLAVGGASLAGEFLRQGLVDEIGVVIHPVILGSGVPMFKELERSQRLQFVSGRVFTNQAASLRYRLVEEKPEDDGASDTLFERPSGLPAGKVSADISMSVDGYIAGPDDTPAQGLGEDGEMLHEWAYDLESFHRRHGAAGGTVNRDSEVLDESFRSSGAVLMGRRMFDLADKAWGENPPFHMPVYVLTHRAHPSEKRQGGTIFHFVTEGIEGTVRQAREAAGGRDVSVAGGADLIRQCLRAGLLDELQVHIAPVLLGRGKRLFEQGGPEIRLALTRMIASPSVTHLRYTILRSGAEHSS